MSKASLELGGTNWAAKDGNLLGYANGSFVDRYIPREFTFSRGSNLAATRINSAGKIEKGRENLLLQSNQFDTTWTTFNASVTSGQSGYDGSSDAWLLNATGASGVVRQTISLSGVQTFSIYAKQGTADAIEINSFSNVSLKVNLTDGSVITSGSANIDSSVTSISNGYYRITITANGSATIWRTYISKTSGSVTSGDNIYIQDAQLEIGLAATDYIESGATTGKAGLLEDEPRFDYSGGATCPSLLLEPSRTQLIGYSEYFKGSNWTLGSGTLTDNTTDTLSPQGLYNASKLDNTSLPSLYYSQISVSASTKYTFSFYAKKGTINTPKLAVYDESNSSFISEDVSYTINTDEWIRIEHTFTTPSNCTLVRVYPLRGVATGSVYLFGVQLEAASYPTSYIPNHSGGSVTRNAESFEKTGLSGVIGQTEGTIFFEFEYFHQKINTPFFRILEDASNLYEIIALSSFKLRSRARIGGSIVASIDTSSVVSEGTHKAAIIYKSGDYKFYLDGSLAGSSTESSIVSNPSEINYFDNNNNLKQFLIFPTTLTDDECIALTTL